ncbi:hypothetical protein GO281_03753 [Ralstonia solanacearum]|nr:hypothetical protein [Ralstonia solanacearum]NKF73008.1 hypothetical protein [Ralstonia solanacearum]
MLWRHPHCALRDIRTRLAYPQSNTGRALRPSAQVVTRRRTRPSGWAQVGARRDASRHRHRLSQWCLQRPLWFRLAMAALDGPSTPTQMAQCSGCGTRTTATTCWFKAGPAVIAADRMHSRIAPPLRFGSPRSPATPGPRAARFGRDGARGCRFVELPLIACRKKGWGWLSLSAGASRLAARQAIGDGRGEPVGGCGTPAEEPALSTPLRGGQRSRPRAGAGTATWRANRWVVDRSPALSRIPYALTPTVRTHHRSAAEQPDFHHIEIVSAPCPNRMSDKGGLAAFGCQFRHAQTWRIGTQRQSAPHPSGVGMHRIPGVV